MKYTNEDGTVVCVNGTYYCACVDSNSVWLDVLEFVKNGGVIEDYKTSTVIQEEADIATVKTELALLVCSGLENLTVEEIIQYIELASNFDDIKTILKAIVTKQCTAP